MGLFSSIKKVIKPVTSAVGSFFGGPIGGAIGSTVGDVLGTIGSTALNNVPAILAGGAQYFGARDANAMNLLIAREATEANRDMAREATQATRDMQQAQFGENRYLTERQIDFQRTMANTAYQRAMKDMRSSGLNPILAYQQGGAAAPAGASGSATGGAGTSGSAVALPMINELAEVSASALAVRRLKKDLEVAEEQKRNIRSQSLKNAQEAALAGALGRKADHDAEISRVGIGTAKQVKRIREREAEDTEKYGTSRLGREGAALERIMRRIYQQFFGEK